MFCVGSLQEAVLLTPILTHHKLEDFDFQALFCTRCLAYSLKYAGHQWSKIMTE